MNCISRSPLTILRPHISPLFIDDSPASVTVSWMEAAEEGLDKPESDSGFNLGYLTPHRIPSIYLAGEECRSLPVSTRLEGNKQPVHAILNSS
jgi:hypothetical protein